MTTAETPAAPFGPDQLDRMRHVVGASMTPDGTRVAVALSWREGDAERRAVRIVTASSGAVVATLDAGGSDDAPVFSPDGTRLAFLSDRGGEVPQLHVADADGGAVRQLTEVPRGVLSAPLWSPDGTRIALAVHAGEAADPAAPRRVERAMWRIDGVGIVDDEATQPLVVEVASGEAGRLVPGDGLARLLAWSPDGTRLLAGVSARPDAAPGDLLREQLYEIGLDGTARELNAHRGAGLLAAYLPDGRVAYTVHIDDEVRHGTASGLWVLEADGTRACRTGDGAFDVLGDVITDTPGDFLVLPRALLLDGGDAIVRVQRRGALGIERVPLAATGAAVSLVADPERCAYPLELRGGRLLYATSSIGEPASLVLAELAEGGAHVPLAVLGEQEACAFPRPRIERDLGSCDMWFMHPTDGAQAPYPTVLLVHGGPFSSFGETFFPTVQLLCGAGFGVLFGNPSGSRGYGDEFAFATYADWGGIDADELLGAVDEAVARGLADRDRLGVSGLSYGGYMTCLLAARTSVFAAAVAENPVVNLLSEQGTSDVGQRLLPAYFGDDPELTPERHRRSSPITYAAGCRTPTLLILGLEDTRCPPTQGFEFHSALRTAGCEAEMLLLPGAAHVGGVTGPVAGRRVQERALVEWFQRFIG